jgi:hypothetical protein
MKALSRAPSGGAAHSTSKAARAARHKPGYQAWREGIDKADAAWDIHDDEIRAVVDAYNGHLCRSAGYLPLDWRVVKAMLWVETGAGQAAWKTRPMQIGNEGDPGLASLLLGDEGGELVLPPSMRPSLSVGGARTDPAQNIRAGVGYLLMRLANYAFRSVLNPDTTVHEVTVRRGDSLEKIARTEGTTVEVLKKLNPAAHMLQPGQVLKYQRAAIQRVITGWNAMHPTRIAQRYNCGDALYAAKFDYAFDAIAKRTVATCEG